MKVSPKDHSRRIYITHCSCQKLESLKGTGKEVPPDKLYTSPRIQRFMDRCKARGVAWGIFSDLYGIYMPNDRHRYYNKPPDTVSEDELKNLVKDFDSKLKYYHEIWFYHHPARFHRLYKRLLQASTLNKRVMPFTHIDEIV